MPTYDYQCLSCSRVIEIIHSMSEDGPSACEVCGGALRRVLFPAGIIFKGSGFYRTDSRASSDTGSTSPKKSESGSSSGGTDGSTTSTGSTSSTSSTGSSTPAVTKKPEGSSSSD